MLKLELHACGMMRTIINTLISRLATERALQRREEKGIRKRKNSNNQRVNVIMQKYNKII